MLLRTTEDLESGNEQKPISHGIKKEILRSVKRKFSRSGEPGFSNSRKMSSEDLMLLEAGK
jgi:hypothetical protein